MLPFINIFDDQNVVFNLEGLCVKLLATNVTDADVKILARCRMGNPTDQLRLTIEEYQFLVVTLHITEGDSAHGTAVANVSIREVDSGQGIRKSRPYHVFEFHFYRFFNQLQTYFFIDDL